MKRSKKIELNLKIEFGRAALVTIFTRRKNYGITCAIPRLEKRERNNIIMYILSRLKKSTHKGEIKITSSHFFSRRGSHINSPLFNVFRDIYIEKLACSCSSKNKPL